MNYNETVTKILIEKNLTITFMESCTSGLLASMFTDTEGASAVFKGCFVTYSNEAKIDAGVNAKVIQDFGVYSPECARAMAWAVKDKFDADVAVGITGSTGNIDPNNEGSIKGEAYYCVITGNEVHDYKISVDVGNMNRKEIKQVFADEVYKNLYDLVQ